MSRGGVHNALSKGSIPSALSRAVGDAEGSSGLERYGETLTPILDLWNQPEWAYLRREVLLGIATGIGAVVAEQGGAAIINPAGSGLIVVVDGAGGQSAATTTFQLGRTLEATILATYGAVGRGIARDGRWNIDQGAAATAGRSLVASGTDAGLFFSSPISRDVNTPNLYASFPDAFPVIVMPGQAVVVEGGTANQAISVRFRWRERVAFPGELE